MTAAEVELPGRRRTRSWGMLWVLVLEAAVLAAGILLSLSIGAVQEADLSTAWEALFHYDGSTGHLIIRTLRLPRTLCAALIGMNLAVAGLLMQGISRNPLAAPGIMGVNAGASLLFVGTAVFLPGAAALSPVGAAFAGAAAGGVLVFAVSGAMTGSVDPLRLVLAGVAISTLLSALTQGLVLFHESATEQVVYWLVGAVDGLGWDDFQIVLPWSAVGLLAALLLARPLDVIAFSDEMARGLGENTDRIRLLAGITVVFLAGAAVAVAGPISFIGLIIPHIARRLVGASHLALLPVCALLGAALLVYADVASRFIAFPFESPAGIVTALIGAPFFLYLAQRQRGKA